MLDILGCKDARFLDPFCGIGIAPLEAWFRGARAFGGDGNRFVLEICRAKIDLIQKGTLDLGRSLTRDYLAFRKAEITKWRRSGTENLCAKAGFDQDATRWFSRSVLDELAVAKEWLNNGDLLDRRWRRVATVILSSVLHRQCSILRNYHYTYIVDRSKVAAPALDDVPVNVVFSERLERGFLDGVLARKYLEQLGCDVTETDPPTLIHGCAQDIHDAVGAPVDVVVTSPPYCGMNDYVRSQYLSWVLFQWDGYNQDLAAESGARRQRRNSECVDFYLHDMRRAFMSVSRILRKGGYLAVVIGASYNRVARAVDVLGCLRSQLDESGLTSVWSGTRRVQFRKINNTPYREEHLWVYRR